MGAAVGSNGQGMPHGEKKVYRRCRIRSNLRLLPVGKVRIYRKFGLENRGFLIIDP